jgi:DNA-binding MarR family transcriptional regulator
MAKPPKLRSETGKALADLGMEVIHTYFKLRSAGERIGATPPAGAGSFGLLRSLKKNGPQTVPQLARAHEVSRQHVQILANGLAEHALVEFADNPAHKRSKLLKITELGERRLAQLTERIEDAYEEISPGMDTAEIRAAIKVLSELRRKMAGV